MRRALVAAGILWFTLAGCAKREPPSGGPPDLVEPRLVASAPDSGRAGVPLTAQVSLTFNESMEPRSTAQAVALAPAVEIRQRRWKGKTLTLVFAEPLRANQTYTLFIASSARDRHGNPFGSGETVVFSTADQFPAGRIEGKIEARGFTAPGTYVWCYDAQRTNAPDSTARDFEALGLADREGQFQIPGLLVPARYRLWAFADLNGNRSFEPNNDVLAPVDTTIELTVERPHASGLALTVVNPRAPGRVRGAVVDSLADTVGVVQVLAVAEDDSSQRHVTEADEDGDFELQLEAGTWLLRAFRDLDSNREWSPERERASERHTLPVEPAADIQEIKLLIRGRLGGP